MDMPIFKGSSKQARLCEMYYKDIIKPLSEELATVEIEELAKPIVEAALNEVDTQILVPYYVDIHATVEKYGYKMSKRHVFHVFNRLLLATEQRWKYEDMNTRAQTKKAIQQLSVELGKIVY